MSNKGGRKTFKVCDSDTDRMENVATPKCVTQTQIGWRMWPTTGFFIEHIRH